MELKQDSELTEKIYHILDEECLKFGQTLIENVQKRIAEEAPTCLTSPLDFYVYSRSSRPSTKNDIEYRKFNFSVPLIVVEVPLKKE